MLPCRAGLSASAGLSCCVLYACFYCFNYSLQFTVRTKQVCLTCVNKAVLTDWLNIITHAVHNGFVGSRFQVPKGTGCLLHRPVDLDLNVGPSAIPCEIPVITGYLMRIWDFLINLTIYHTVAESISVGCKLGFPILLFFMTLLWYSLTLLSLEQYPLWGYSTGDLLAHSELSIS